MATNRDKQCRGKNLLANIANNQQQQKQAWSGQEQQQQSNGPGRQAQRRQHFVNHSIYQIEEGGCWGAGYIGGFPDPQFLGSSQLVGSIAMASVHIIERFLVLLSLVQQHYAHIFFDGALKVEAISPLHVC